MTDQPVIAKPLDLRITGRCNIPACSAPMLLTQTQWRSLSPEDRRLLRELRVSEGRGRRLCTRHYRRAGSAGELIDHEPRHMRAEDLADDYITIRDELPTGASARRRYEAAAERLSKSRSNPVHPDSIRRALRVTGNAP